MRPQFLRRSRSIFCDSIIKATMWIASYGCVLMKGLISANAGTCLTRYVKPNTDVLRGTLIIWIPIIRFLKRGVHIDFLHVVVNNTRRPSYIFPSPWHPFSVLRPCRSMPMFEKLYRLSPQIFIYCWTIQHQFHIKLYDNPTNVLHLSWWWRIKLFPATTGVWARIENTWGRSGSNCDGPQWSWDDDCLWYS